MSSGYEENPHEEAGANMPGTREVCQCTQKGVIQEVLVISPVFVAVVVVVLEFTVNASIVVIILAQSQSQKGAVVAVGRVPARGLVVAFEANTKLIAPPH